MPKEQLSLTLREEKPISIISVLDDFYPEYKLGKKGCSNIPLIKLLAHACLGLSPEIFTSLKEGSSRGETHINGVAGEVILFHELAKTVWSTPSVRKNTTGITEAGLKFVRDDLLNKGDDLLCKTMRKSTGLTSNIAVEFNVGLEVITRAIRGIRIDGVYIAQKTMRHIVNYKKLWIITVLPIFFNVPNTKQIRK